MRQTMVALSTIQHMVSFSTIVRRARVHAQARLDLAMTDTRAQVSGLLSSLLRAVAETGGQSAATDAGDANGHSRSVSRNLELRHEQPKLVCCVPCRDACVQRCMRCCGYGCGCCCRTMPSVQREEVDAVALNLGRSPQALRHSRPMTAGQAWGEVVLILTTEGSQHMA